MTPEFKLLGAKELEKVLHELGPAVANKVGGQALRAMAKPIIEQAQRTVAVGDSGPPHIRDNIRVSVPNKVKEDGSRTGFIGFHRDVSWRVHFLEFGTRHSAAKPFIRPALDEKADEAFQAMGRALARGMAREARKLAGGG